MQDEDGRAAGQQRVSPEQAYQGLRQLALTVSAEELGVDVGPREPYGVIIDLAFPKATVTLVAMAEGTVSAYFSTGGGILGGGQYDAARSAGLTLIEEAAEHVESMREINSFPVPATGHTRMTVLTELGAHSEEAPEADLKSKRSGLWPLYYYAQELLGELSAIAEGPGEES